MVYVFSLYWLRDDTSLRILGASAQNRNKDVRRMLLLSNVLFVNQNNSHKGIRTILTFLKL